MASEAAGLGGGGGGGKIRTRRCHPGPIKPYQQGRPQHQVRGSGLPSGLAGRGLAGGGTGGEAPWRPTWGGPEGPEKGPAEARPGRGCGGGSSGCGASDGKWAETGRCSPRTRVVRAASSQPSRAGAPPAGAWREQKSRACGARFFRFLAGRGVSGLLLTSSRGRWGGDVAGGPCASGLLVSCVSVLVGRELPRGKGAPGVGEGAVTQSGLTETQPGSAFLLSPAHVPSPV